MACPDDQTLKLFFAGRIAYQQAEEIEAHLESCPACSKRLDELEAGSDIPLFDDIQLDDIRAANQSGSESGTVDDDGSIPSNIPATIGHYEVRGLLGTGGMGEVFLGTNPHLGRTVAIKVIKPNRRIHQSSVGRFSREMKAVGKLHQPNIVQALDGGVVDGQPFLVMEFLEGSDLSNYVKEYGPLSVEQACDIIRQAAIGLTYAHRLGYVHRDVKPSNLWLTPDGTVKILDFGLVSILENEAIAESTETSQHETVAGSILGSPDYISPEQIVDSKKTDNRSDIYSLGCTFYFLLTGRPPFDKATHPTLDNKLEAHASEDLPPLRQYRNDIPVSVETVMRKMTAKRPEDRYDSAESVVKAITSRKPHRSKWIAGTVVSVVLLAVGSFLFLPPEKPTIEKPISSVVEEKPMELLPESDIVEPEEEPLPQTSKIDPSKISTNSDIGNWFLDRTITESHGDYGSALFTVDGRHIIDAQTNGGVQLWNTSGIKTNRFDSNGAVTAVAQSSDGKWLAFSEYSQPAYVRFYDLESGSFGGMISSTTMRQGPITTLVFSNDGTRLFIGGSGGELWNIDPRDRSRSRPQKIISELKGRVTAAVFSAGGDKIYIGDDQKNLYCFRTDMVMQTFGSLELPNNVTCLKRFPEGTAIAVLTGLSIVNYVDIGNVSTNPSGPNFQPGTPSRTITRIRKTRSWVHPNRNAKLYCIAFSPDQTRAALGGDGLLDIWNMKRGDIEESLKLDDPTDRIIALDFHRYGERLLARTLNTGDIQLWRFQPHDVRQTTNSSIPIPDSHFHSPTRNRALSDRNP